MADDELPLIDIYRCVFGNRYYVTIAACGVPYIICVIRR